MRWPVLLVLVISALGWADRLERIDRIERLREGGASLAYFEFAPASGAGMTAPCACTNPTGAKGETLTFTRASSGTCLTGGTTSGIANGSMVTCSTNQPRVMPGGDGSGARGLLVEGARTNTTLRSQEFDNAAWGKNNSGSSDPTVTANQGVAPDGTTTADRYQFPATTGSNYSQAFQLTSCPTGTQALSLFVKGFSGSGQVDLYATNGCVQCSFNSTTWTRCATTTSTGAALAFGNVGAAACGAGDRSAADVLVWGAQCEAGAFASSYIATTSASVTRAVEVPTFTSASGFFNTQGSAAGTIVLSNVTSAGSTGGMVTFSATQRALRADFAGASGFSILDSTNEAFIASGAAVGVPVRGYSYWQSGGIAACVSGGSCDTDSFDNSMQSGTTIEIGNNTGGGGPLWGVIKQVCLDPSPTRCR